MLHEGYGLVEALLAFVGFNLPCLQMSSHSGPGFKNDHYLRHAVLMVEDRSKKSKAESSESHLLTFYWLK